MTETTVTAEQLADFLRRKGRVGSQTLSVLGKYRPFVEAINSEVGKEILRDAILVHESLLTKVADLTATPEETMEYKCNPQGHYAMVGPDCEIRKEPGRDHEVKDLFDYMRKRDVKGEPF